MNKSFALIQDLQRLKGSNLEVARRAYHIGTYDAWRLYKEIADMPVFDRPMYFDDNKLEDIPNKYTFEEALECFSKYERDNITVGDEISVKELNNFAVVIKVDEAYVKVVTSKGDVKIVNKNLVNKTGKHYDLVEELFKQMRGEPYEM